jgi:GT2 family glycosyltransferase
MVKLCINLLRWNSPWAEIQNCINAVLDSDLENFRLVYTENFNPDVPSLSEQVRSHFGSDARLQIHQNDTNLGYANGHNRFFAETDCPLLMVLNPDAVIDRSFLRKITQAFADPTVGAATGKMLKPYLSPDGRRVLDGTGIVMRRSRRAYERGQNEVDRGQYDNNLNVFGVSGTAAVYRKSALESVKIGTDEYFDSDFFAYWEDLDLSWRMRLAGFKCAYVPEAIVEHERAVGSSPGGVFHFTRFVRHHQQIPIRIHKWSWRNHLFTIIKNDQGWYFWRNLPFIVCRELAMIGFLLCFSPRTLTEIPRFARLLPRMLRKRKQIMASRKAAIDSLDQVLP